MKNDNSLPSTDLISIIPRNQYTFQYKINDGNFHTISKYNIGKFLSEYINGPKNQKILNNLIVTFRPFLILPSENLIIEMKKSENIEKINLLQQVTDKELELIRKQSIKTEKIPGDTQIEKIFSKIKKIF